MASAFTHGITAIALERLTPHKVRVWPLLILGIFLSAMPDLDVIGHRLGIDYAHPMGHRGFTHSIFFAFLISLIATGIFYRKMLWSDKGKWVIWLYLFLATASHGVLDAMTTGGMGIGFFIPLDNSRYFLPWRIIQVSPMSIKRFFSEWGVMVLQSEFRWIWIPSLVLIFIGTMVKRLVKL